MQSAKVLIKTQPGAFEFKRELVLALCRGVDMSQVTGPAALAEFINVTADGLVELYYNV